MSEFKLFTVENLPMFRPGDDVAALIAGSLAAMDESLQDGDIIVIAQKIVSKAEGRLVCVADVELGEQAVAIAEATGKDASIVRIERNPAGGRPRHDGLEDPSLGSRPEHKL